MRLDQARVDRVPQRGFAVEEIALAVDEPETEFAKVVSSHCATIEFPGEVSRQGVEVLPMERGRVNLAAVPQSRPQRAHQFETLVGAIWTGVAAWRLRQLPRRAHRHRSSTCCAVSFGWLDVSTDWHAAGSIAPNRTTATATSANFIFIPQADQKPIAPHHAGDKRLYGSPRIGHGFFSKLGHPIGHCRGPGGNL
jgi:hypothetical protein